MSEDIEKATAKLKGLVESFKPVVIPVQVEETKIIGVDGKPVPIEDVLALHRPSCTDDEVIRIINLMASLAGKIQQYTADDDHDAWDAYMGEQFNVHGLHHAGMELIRSIMEMSGKEFAALIHAATEGTLDEDGRMYASVVHDMFDAFYVGCLLGAALAKEQADG